MTQTNSTWRQGRHFAEHVYEYDPAVSDGDGADPVASFLGNQDDAARNAQETVIAVNTIRALGTSSFTRQFQVQIQLRNKNWVPVKLSWIADWVTANQSYQEQITRPAQSVRIVSRWVSAPTTIEETNS